MQIEQLFISLESQSYKNMSAEVTTKGLNSEGGYSLGLVWAL